MSLAVDPRIAPLLDMLPEFARESFGALISQQFGALSPDEQEQYLSLLPQFTLAVETDDFPRFVVLAARLGQSPEGAAMVWGILQSARA